MVVVGLAVVPPPAAARWVPLSSLKADHDVQDADHDAMMQALANLQAAIDALGNGSNGGGSGSNGGTVFPGDGVQGAPLRYQDNGDGTITDLNTGLMWETKVPGGGSCTGALHAVDATCTWAQATGDWINAVNTEGGTGYAGYDDWRVPNVRELMSIVDYSRSSPAISLIFTPTAADFYWSSTSSAASPPSAWSVDFNDGFVNVFGENNTFRVRAVRGGR
jgi:hypothetical protein